MVSSRDLTRHRIGVLIGLVFLSFLIDGGVGGGMLLRTLVSNPTTLSHINLFFWALLASSAIFSIVWVITNQRFATNIRQHMFLLIILCVLSVLGMQLTVASGSMTVFLSFVPLLFNLLSFSAYSIATLIMVEVSMLEHNGRWLGVGAAWGLLFAALSIAVGGFGDPVQLQLIRIFLSLVALSLPAGVLVWINWQPAIRNGVSVLKPADDIKTIPSLDTRHLALAIGSGALFLFGSGMAHNFLVASHQAILNESRIPGLLVSALVILVCSELVDRLGWYVLLVAAILLTTGALLIAIFFSATSIMAALEIAGYYAVLAFIMGKVAHHTSSSRFWQIGIAWSVIYIADFAGALVSNTLLDMITRAVLPLHLLFYTSIAFMLLSLLLVALVPNITKSKLKITRFTIIGEEPKSEQDRLLKEFALSLDDNETRAVELNDGSKVIVSSSNDVTSAAFVNIYSSNLEQKLQQLSVAIGKLTESTPDSVEFQEQRVNSTVTQFLAIYSDPNGIDIQYMK